MKIYTAPELEVTKLNLQDVITTSPICGSDTACGNDTPWQDI